jgi:acyl dehydratase
MCTEDEDQTCERTAALALGEQMPHLLVKNPKALSGWVGKEIGVTEWFRVSQERIEQFAEATEDRQWIHVDRVKASKESPYSATVAHGFLTLSLISHLVKRLLQVQKVRLGVNYGLNRVRFPSAVWADSRIRASPGLRCTH